jgi:hypothetical protein
MSISEEKAIALGNLIGEMDVASEVTLGQRLVPGRIIEEYHGKIATGKLVPQHMKYPGEKGGKRMKLVGGGICEEQPWVRLSIDAAIVLASAAVVVGAGYTGFATLQSFMNVYGLNESSIAIITSLYNSLIATGGAIFTTVYNMGSASVTVTTSIGTVGSTILTGLYSSAGPILSTFARAAPAVAIGRYIGTNKNAYEDAKNIINTLDAQYKALASYTGAVTRSMSEKKESIERQLTAAKQSFKTTYENAKTKSEAVITKSSSYYLALRTKVCQLVDRGISAVDVTAGLEEALATINFEGGRRRTRRSVKKARRSIKKRRNSMKKRRV